MFKVQSCNTTLDYCNMMSWYIETQKLHIKGWSLQPIHLGAISTFRLIQDSYCFDLSHHGLLSLRWLAATLVQTVYNFCYSMVRPVLHKLIAQYFLTRKRPTWIAQNLCQSENSAFARNSHPSSSGPSTYIQISDRWGRWICKMATTNTTSSTNDQEPTPTKTFCCLFIWLE